MHLRGALRQYLATQAALGITVDIRNTASYHSALSAFKRATGADWSGNP